MNLKNKDVVAGISFGKGIGLTPFVVEIVQLVLKLDGTRCWNILEEYFDPKIGIHEIKKLLTRMRVKRRIIFFWTGAIDKGTVAQVSGEYDLPIYVNQISGPGAADLGYRTVYSLLNDRCLAISKERSPHLFEEIVRGQGGVAFDALRFLITGVGEGPNPEDRLVPLEDQQTLIRDRDGSLRENQPAVNAQWKKKQDPYADDPYEQYYSWVMGDTGASDLEYQKSVNQMLGIKDRFLAKQREP
jgi:hypothetical protein